ncbi:MAG TPA: amidohydrolase family protein [Chloroflexota bacterium]|nr:amidohydrolase family protein [Chloroflexota bacterium]
MSSAQAPADSVLIRNIGALVSGDVHAPIVDASSIYIANGLIAAIGSERSAQQTVDAASGLVAPGLWDADHHTYFGDHTPQLEARGYLEATLRAGTTSVIAAGLCDLPGRPRDGQGTKQLAILAARSWRYDRPRNIKVHAGTVIAEPGLREADFGDLARAGVNRLSFMSEVPSIREAQRYVEWAHANGMAVMAHCAGAKLIEEARSVEHALRAIKPDVACQVNGGPRPPPDEVVDWLFDETRCALGLTLMGGLKAARRVIRKAADRDELDRVVIGTDTPSGAGVIPGGVQRTVQLLTTVSGVQPETALAFATGNTSRAFGLPGGRIEVGQPADLIVAHPADGSLGGSGDGLDGLARGEWLAITNIVVDGHLEV